MAIRCHMHPGAGRPVEHPGWNFQPTARIGTAQATAKISAVRSLDRRMNADPKAKPWMPRVQQFSKLSSVGVLKLCCTMAGGHTRALTARHPIKPTSRRCLSAWQPNPGRRSTYRRGDSVQTTGATSQCEYSNAKNTRCPRCRSFSWLELTNCDLAGIVKRCLLRNETLCDTPTTLWNACAMLRNIAPAGIGGLHNTIQCTIEASPRIQ